MLRPIHATETGRKFYEAYRPLIALSNIKRSGAILCGYFGTEERDKLLDRSVEGPFFKNRVQSDQEHCDELKNIVFLLSVFYPWMFRQPDGEYERYGGHYRFYLLHFLVTIHELGELGTGDIPDDGTRDNEAKDKDEFAFIENYLIKAGFPPALVNLGVGLMREMQATKELKGEDQTELGVIGTQIDKCGAILKNFILEAEGKKGSMNYKDVSALDRSHMEYTGNDSPVDNWFYHTLVIYPIFFDEKYWKYTAVFLEIIQSFSLAIRGKEIGWLNDFIASHN
ncbi:hypothetical protein IKP94_00840 [Candidatus Saccharibacteria bacterium]|nr:hypothetical protein [Candidatus Saccharibacteria bacterium]MBR6964869.1 hypothetical protein [Candidatus Saccharibacteria bacterium]